MASLEEFMEGVLASSAGLADLSYSEQMDRRMKSSKEITDHVLPDGGSFEGSPSYTQAQGLLSKTVWYLLTRHDTEKRVITSLESENAVLREHLKRLYNATCDVRKMAEEAGSVAEEARTYILASSA